MAAGTTNTGRASWFGWLGLELHIAGCPNTCRHCKDDGRPPCGGLMSVADARWVVEEFGKATGMPVVAPVLHHEPTAHPDFIELLELFRDPSGEQNDQMSTLSTNGYGIARADDPAAVLQQLQELGARQLSLTLHGAEARHDRFVRRRGAYGDVWMAARLGAGARLTIYLNLFPDRESAGDLDLLLGEAARLGDETGQAPGISVCVPSYVAGRRLREYERTLRPRLSDLEPEAIDDASEHRAAAEIHEALVAAAHSPRQAAGK